MSLLFPTPIFRSTSKALLIGCNYNGETTNQLRGCIDDVKHMAGYYRSMGIKDLRVITDSPGELWMPTCTGIRQGFEWLLSDLKKDDVLILHYSGHGTKVKNDLLLVPKDYKDRGYIADDELFSYMMKIPAGVSLFAVFDACHSGSMLELRYNYTDGAIITNKNKETNADIVMISGCGDNQTSADTFINGLSQGAMSWALLRSMKENPECSWQELVDTIRKFLKARNYTQIPQLSSGRPLDLTSKFLQFL